MRNILIVSATSLSVFVESEATLALDEPAGLVAFADPPEMVLAIESVTCFSV